MSSANAFSAITSPHSGSPAGTAQQAPPVLLRDPSAEVLAPDIWEVPRAATDSPAQSVDEVTQQRAEVVQLHLPSTVPVPIVRVQIRHRWTGSVLEVGDEWFRAELTNQDETEAPREVAEFDRAAISQGDESLLAVGAIFYWSVGYETRRGTCRTFSEVRFRRLPEWTASELRKLEEPSDLDEFFR